VLWLLPQVRHAGYTSLQSTLWQRSQARAVARGQPEGRAQLSSGLMDSLDAVRGRLAPGWVPGARFAPVLQVLSYAGCSTFITQVGVIYRRCHHAGLCLSCRYDA
jgi:hypothetical protein